MPKMLNRARMTTTTTGTGTITLGSAATGYATFAEAGAVNAAVYAYTIEDGNDFEIGVGTYTSSGTTFSRDTVTLSKIGGTSGTSKINLSGSAQIFITARVEDLTPAYALISRQVASNSAALSWTGLDTTNYDSFELVLENIIPVTNNRPLLLQVGTGATPTWQTSGYVNLFASQTGGITASTDNSGSVQVTVGNTSNLGLSGNINIGNLGAGTYKFARGNYAYYNANISIGVIAGYYNATTAITALRLIFDTNNISSGIASLYCRRN